MTTLMMSVHAGWKQLAFCWSPAANGAVVGRV